MIEAEAVSYMTFEMKIKEERQEERKEARLEALKKIDHKTQNISGTSDGPA